ncbi:MAG: hypothetical protein JWN72_627 [Thermoleophilia bacterium]|nr:hypothetical protein [Thermoleophilia bacterium]
MHARNASLRRFAASHHCVASILELRELGFASSTVYDKVRAGQFQLVHPRVVNLGIDDLTLAGRCRAAVLACGNGCLLTGPALGQLLGVMNPASVTIDIVATHHAGSLDRVTVHRTRLLPPRMLVDGIDAVFVPELICSLATHATYPELAHVLHRLAWKRHLDLEELDRYVAVQHRRRGVCVVRAALELHRTGSAGARSMSEVQVHSMLIRMRVPRFLFNASFDTPTRRLEPDFRFPELKLVIEVDGRHDTPEQMGEDCRRDQALRDAGYRVLRIGWLDVWKRPHEVESEIALAIAQARIAQGLRPCRLRRGIAG